MNRRFRVSMPTVAALIAIPLQLQAADSQFSMSLRERPFTTADGIVTTPEAAGVNEAFGADQKRVVKVTDGVYSLIGWGIANTAVIDAPKGYIIVDTGDSHEAASSQREVLEKTLGKKVKAAAVLYTHSHYVHGTGARAAHDLCECTGVGTSPMLSFTRVR